MLYRLSADRPEFKTLRFKPGLNIVLATRSDDEAEDGAGSDHRRSRNGAGKSSIVDLIHFLLGGKAEGALKAAHLAEWNFVLDLDVGAQRLAIRRSVANAKRVVLIEEGTAVEHLTNAEWCQKLGEAWFN